MSTNMAGTDADRWDPLRDFSAHIITGGTLLFLLSTIPIGIHVLLSWAEQSWSLPTYIIWPLRGLELFSLAVDVACALAFFTNTAWRFYKSLDWGPR